MGMDVVLVLVLAFHNFDRNCVVVGANKRDDTGCFGEIVMKEEGEDVSGVGCGVVLLLFVIIAITFRTMLMVEDILGKL
jgi:hypothetical protein